jgi:dUTP pyrophosphatase
MNEIKVARIKPDAILPTRNNETDAGLDLYSYYDYIIKNHEVHKVRTGCAILIPEGYVGILMPKSRSDYVLGGGVVDAGYTGEIIVKVVNTSGHTIAIAYGDAIAQLVLLPIAAPKVKEVNYPYLISEGVKLSARGQEGGINR